MNFSNYNKEQYINLCKEEKSLSFFSRNWWLDSVCGEDNWNVVIIKKDNVIIGAMPYYKRSRMGMKIISQPPLTPFLGPWIRPLKAKYCNQLAYQKEVLSQIIHNLPNYDHFIQNFHYDIKNFLPFYWNNFNQKTFYTYTLEDLSNLDVVFSNFRENIKTDIRKASNRFSLHVRTDLTIDDFLVLNHKTFQRQQKSPPYDDEFIKKLDQACQKQECRKIFIAEDDQGRHHAGVYIVWDENSAYYLMGGGDPNLRTSGATSLCMWEAICYASKVTKKFDFEGSMIEPVERFFRSFGALQTPYFQISKTPSKLLRIGNFLRELKC